MYQRIMVAVDGSEPSKRALEEAVHLAGEMHSKLRLIYVVDFGSLLVTGAEGVDVEAFENAWCAAGHRVLNQGAEVARASGVEADTGLLESDGQSVSATVAAEAAGWHADLLVLGTHGRHGIGRAILGSVAEGVARDTNVPVLLVHPR